MNETEHGNLLARLGSVDGRLNAQVENSKTQHKRIHDRVEELYRKQEKFVEELHGLKLFIIKVAAGIVFAIGGSDALLKFVAF